MFKIEKDIQIQEFKRGPSKYPFEQMEVGDSIFVPENEAVPGIYSAPSYYAIRHPRTKFTTRKVEGGYRIWRIK